MSKSETSVSALSVFAPHRTSVLESGLRLTGFPPPTVFPIHPCCTLVIQMHEHARMVQGESSADGETSKTVGTMQQLNPLVATRFKVSVLGSSGHTVVISSPVRIMPGALVQVRMPGRFLLGTASSCEAGGGRLYEVLLHIESSYHLADALLPAG